MCWLRLQHPAGVSLLLPSPGVQSNQITTSVLRGANDDDVSKVSFFFTPTLFVTKSATREGVGVACVYVLCDCDVLLCASVFQYLFVCLFFPHFEHVRLLLPASDPLELKTSASAEWSSSHKGMDPHTHTYHNRHLLFFCIVSR